MTAKVLRTVRYDDTELDDNVMMEIKKVLKETDEKRIKCMETLKKKLLSTPDLNPCLDEYFLVAFLRVSKYDCNKAYQRMIALYKERHAHPDVYGEYSTSTIKVVENARYIRLSPYRPRDNSMLVLYKRLSYDPSKIPYDVIMRGVCMIGDIALKHPLNQMFGFTVVIDLKPSAWSNWSEYTPARLKLMARLVEKMPVRVKAVHILNAPPIYFFIYSILYPFLSSKIRNRISIHKSHSSLLEYLEPEVLPKEYGGCLEQSELINMYDRVYEEEDFLRRFSKYGFVKNIK